jgi:hypothetical protein
MSVSAEHTQNIDNTKSREAVDAAEGVAQEAIFHLAMCMDLFKELFVVPVSLSATNAPPVAPADNAGGAITVAAAPADTMRLVQDMLEVVTRAMSSCGSPY